MAYSKKKKRYKLNKGKKVIKAQDGVTDVLDTVVDMAGNFGGGEGLPLEDIWAGVVDTVTNLNLGNINLPTIVGKGANIGGSGGGTSEGGGSDDDTPSGKTSPKPSNNLPSFFQRNYANLSTDELRDAYGQHYDFGRFSDMIDHDKNAMANRYKTGRHHKWSQLFHTPENVNFDYTDKQGRKVGTATNTHPANLSAILMDVAQKDPEAIKWLMTNSHQYAPRTDAVTNLNEKYGLEKGVLSSKDRRYMRGIDEDQLKRQYEKLALMKEGKRYGKYRGHAYDVDMMNQLLGQHLPKGMKIDSQMADLMHDFVDSKMFTDAMASMHPDIFDPGVVGIDDKGKYGAYQVRRNPGEGMDQFINAPLNYQYNMEASGLDPNQKPSQEWLRMQYMSNQGAEDGMGGYNKDQIAQMLMQDEEFLAKNNLSRSDLARGPLGYAQTTGDLYRFGVTWDDKNKKWYSEGTKDWLTPEQAEKWTSAIANKYIDDSGWQQYNPNSKIDPINIGTVPSNKIDETITAPTGLMSFNEADSDVGDDIEDLQGSVEVGPMTGGYELDSEGNRVPSAKSGTTSGGSRQKRSMDAILNSVASGTHVGTGEGYNEADLKRDAAIIKKEFGNDAYNDLMNQLSSISPVEPSSSQSAVSGGGDDSRGKQGQKPVSFTSGDEDSSMFDFGRDFGPRTKEDQMSIYEQVQRLRNPEMFDDEDEDENEESTQSSENEDSDSSGESSNTPMKKVGRNLYYGSGFAGDSGLSQQQQEEMMNMGITPIYKHGGFGKGFDMNKMKFYEKGGKALYANDGANFSSIANAFKGGGGGGTGVRGFNIAPIYNVAPADAAKSGEVYLETKLIRLDKELKSLDPNDPANEETIAALQQEIMESQAELAALRGGGPGTSY
jgi:hypothetical protein